MDDNYWKTEKNIIFCTASENDIPELVTFIHENFLPHEPTNRMIKTVNGNTWLDKYLRDYLILTFIKNPIINFDTTPGCMVARSTIDNSILGCRMGEIVIRGNERDDKIPPIMWIRNLPSCLPIPKKLIDTLNLVQLMRDLRYGKQYAFEELVDTNMIYIALKVCVSPKARGLGLGSELIRRGYEMAKSTGCGYTYVLASSLYSQMIFHRLGNCQVLQEAKYEEYKYDKKGRPFLDDAQEHIVLQVLAIRHLDD